MDSLISGGNIPNDNKSFFNHIFSTSDESKAEFLNVVQYSLIGIFPIVFLNKTIQKFIPDLDIEKSSLEILAEIFIQILFMFFGIIFIHRFITFFPTYSGFKYDSFSLTNVILAFFIIIFSIQTKLGLKVNTLFTRASSAFFGDSNQHEDNNKLRPFKHFTNQNLTHTANHNTNHSNSQADFYDHSTNNPISILPTPTNNSSNFQDSFSGPVAANSFIGSSFGAHF
jgi:hypothetical protein